MHILKKDHFVLYSDTIWKLKTVKTFKFMQLRQTLSNLRLVGLRLGLL